MKNINEITKEMTRSEFMNWYTDCNNCEGCPNSGFGINIDDDEMCKKHEGNCIDCIREATRDIKFKGDIEETFEAICINKGDTKYLTNDKTYLVSQSKEYEGYYDTVNDIGNIDSYRKERFKVVVQQFGEDEENNIQILSNGNIILNIKDSEVEKVEDKRCLNDSRIGNDKKGRCLDKGWEDIKNCEGRIKPQHTLNYVEEQLEYAKEKENRCYNEKCNRNDKNGKYQMKEQYYIDNCTSRDIEQPIPINYEEEHKKLKEENDMLRCQYEEAQKVANSFEIMADKYREKQKAMESDLIKYEDTIKTLKGIIKNISEVL